MKTSLVHGSQQGRGKVLCPIRVRHTGSGGSEVAYAQANEDLLREGLPEIELGDEDNRYVYVNAVEASGIETGTVEARLGYARTVERLGAILGGRGIELELDPAFAASLEPLPALPLYVAVAAGCNLKCWYCTEHGENRAFGPHVLSTSRLLELLEIAYDCGFRVFRFTGGEPTLRKDLGEIMRHTQELGEDVEIAMTTNGMRLEGLLDTLAGLDRPKVFLSVDGLAQSAGGAPREGREFEVSKWLTDEVDELIERTRSVARVRLNYVLTRTSFEQIWELIDFAAARALDVKVFELLLRDFIGTGGLSRRDAFEAQYLPIRSLVPELIERYGEPAPFPGLGGRGIPMRFVSTGASRVIYFDSLAGSHYSGKICDNCNFFPCQEGLYAPVLNASGILHPAGCMHPWQYWSVADAGRRGVAESFAGVRAEILRSRLRPEVPVSLENVARRA